MVTINIKGHEITPIHIKDSYDRRALQYMNNIIKLLSSIGVTEDDYEIAMENVAIRKAPASVSWYFDDHHLFYSYNASNKFVENLAMVHKILELEIKALIDGERSVEEFVLEFREEHDVELQRINARKVLGLDEDVKDLAVIDKAFKTLAKEHHPDKEGGDVIKFKEINRAHKILRRELQ
jgi:hypothetical protein